MAFPDGRREESGLDRKAVFLVAGARPNFMKIAPLFHALKDKVWCETVVVHTGQHYDAEMSDVFFRDLGLPECDAHLGVGSGTHAEQTAGVMIAFERICIERRPDLVVVVGDVNSTLACAITARKLCIPVGHVESGLRSRDMTMPEEINRVVTDSVSDILWTPSPDADENLLREGIPESRIERVGNIMIDSYEMLRGRIELERAAESLGLTQRDYAVVTLHRPSNVDDRDKLVRLVTILTEVGGRLPVVFPVHPRTRGCLEKFGLWKTLNASERIRAVEPMGYLRFMSLVKDARLVITDSGGIQEETTHLNIPCLTLRESTERPVTVSRGTNRLVNEHTLTDVVERVMEGNQIEHAPPDMWDGRTAERIVRSIKRWFEKEFNAAAQADKLAEIYRDVSGV